MAIKSKAQIQAESNSTYVDNSVGGITPNAVRGLNTNWIDSIIFVEATASLNVFSATSASFATSASRAESAATASFLTGTVASASFAIQAGTASFLLGSVESASFATSASRAISSATATSASYSLTSSLAQRNLITASAAANILTFTKGDGTTFSVSIAQSGSVQSASFADTANQANSASLASNSLLLQGTGSNGFVTTASFATTSGSLSTRVTSLESFSSSLNSTFATDAELNAATQSLSASISTVNSNLTVVSSSLLQVSASYIALSASYNTSSGSASTRITNLESFSSSLDATFATDAQLNAATQSLSASTSTVNTRVTEVSASLLQVSSSYIALSGSYNVSSGSQSIRTTTLESTASALVLASGSFSTRVTNTEVTSSNLVAASASFSTRVSDNTSNIQTLTSATASFAVLAANQTFSGKNTFNNDVTMSNVLVTGTASVAFLNVTFQSSSVIYASGSNQFGDAPNDTQTLWGTVDIISGPLVVTGSANFKNVITGSISGNAATATTSTSASYADTANFANTAEFATSASLAQFAGIASAALTASYAYTASSAVNSTNALTASFAPNSLITASVVNSTITFTKGDNTTFNITVVQSGSVASASYADVANFANSASYAYTASSAVNATNALTASSVSTLNQNVNITGSLTASGLNYPTVDGLQGQVLKTDGTNDLAFGDVNTMYETVYTGENITKSDPLYISGSQGANPIVYKADAANAAKMPVTYIASETIAAGNTTRGIVLGLIEGIDLTGYTAGTEVYVAAGGGWTSTRPTGSAIVQILGIVTKGGAGGKGLVLNPGPVDLPNLQAGYAWVGDSNGVPQAVSTSSLLVTNAVSSSYAYTASSATNAGSSISASYALTASYLDGAVPAFPFTGSAGISGSLDLVGRLYIPSGSIEITGSATIISGSLTMFSYKFETPSNRPFEALVTQSLNSTNNIISLVGAGATGSLLISGSGNYISLNTIASNVQHANGATSGFNGTNAYITVMPVTTGSNPNFNTTADRNNRRVPQISNSNVNASITVNDNRQSESSVAPLSISNSSINSNVVVTVDSGSFSINNSNIAGASLTVSSSNATGSAAGGVSSIANSILANNGINVRLEGSASRSATINSSIIAGTTTRLLVSASAAYNAAISSNLIVGDNLIVTSSYYTSGFGLPVGSAFLGSFNAADGVLNSPQFTRFAIGTGTVGSARRTSFHVSASGLTTISDGLVVSGSAIFQALSGSFSGSGANIFGVVSSSYAYTASSAVISLSSSYSDNSNTANSATSATSASYAYTASSAISAGTASYATQFIVSGSQVITGSLVGQPVSQSVSSNTASLDLAVGNFFNLSLPASTNTYITASGQVPGQTINLKITQGATTGSVTLGAGFKQVSGSAYTVTATANAVDIVTFISFDNTGLYVSNVKNLI